LRHLTPDELKTLRQELGREDLQVLTSVVLARRDVQRGEVEVALARLMVDADKLRCFDTQLTQFLVRK
jgi:hypothetical protein